MVRKLEITTKTTARVSVILNYFVFYFGRRYLSKNNKLCRLLGKYDVFIVLYLIRSVRVFTESTTPSHEQLPVVFESTDDPSLNLTRTDLNCDKTGTCYDGKYLHTSYSTVFNYIRPD